MKSVFFLLSLVSSVALADIPLPDAGHTENGLATSVIEGEAALTLYNSLDTVQEFGEPSVRTSTVTVKVVRSEDGLAQVVCRKVVSVHRRNHPSVSCETTRSTTGVVTVPAYKPKIRRG